MTIRFKGLVYAIGVLAVFIASAYLIADKVVLKEFVKLELADLDKKESQLKKIVQAEEHRLGTLVRDWAIWDDTYRFVTQKSPQYIQTNFGPPGTTLEDLDITLLLIVDKKGRIVAGEEWGEGKHPKRFTAGVPLPYISQGRFGEILRQNELKNLLVKSGEKLILLALHPVVDSANEKSPNGMVIMGRVVDSSLVERFGAALGYPLRLLPVGTLPDEKKVRCEAAHCHGVMDLLDSKREMAGYFAFEVPRDIYREGEKTVRVFMGMFALVGVVATVILFFLLNGTIFSRLARLSGDVGELELDEKSTPGVDEAGRDEISSLAVSINRMLRRIQEANQKERARNNHARLLALGRLTRDIAHHWRQPINVVGLLVQEIKLKHDYGELDAKTLEDTVDKAMERIDEMSRVLNDFQKLYSPQRERSLFEIGEKVQSALTILEKSIADSGVVVTYKEGGTCRVDGFESDFIQVLVSMVTNSLEAIEKAGVEEGRITVEFSREGNYGVISIADNGGGISDKVAAQMYEPYFSTKSELNGTGIGLYMAKIVLESEMGGAIEAHNSQEGATFVIKLPCSEA